MPVAPSLSMPALSDDDSVSVALIQCLIRGAGRLGLDTDALLFGAGLCPHVRAKAEGRVPHAALVRLWDALSSCASREDFGLWLAAHENLLRCQKLHHVLNHGRRLLDSLTRVTTYTGVLQDGVQISVDTGPSHTTVRYVAGTLREPARRHAVDYVFASIAIALGTATGGSVLPAAVRLVAQAPSDTSAHERVFGCVPRFETGGDALEYRTSDLEVPGPFEDPDLLHLVEQELQARLSPSQGPTSVSVRLRIYIGRALPHGVPTLAGAARALGLSERSLQRRLQAEGTSFAEVLERLRHALALRLVRDTSLPLAEVANKIGFCDQSSFHHAFMRWEGCSPGRVRRSLAPRKSARIRGVPSLVGIDGP